jgi:hypothetical protein
MSDETLSPTETVEIPDQNRRPVRPLKLRIPERPAPEPEKPTPEPEKPVKPEPAKPSLRERLASVAFARGRRTMMKPAELQGAREKRMAEVAAALDAYNQGRTQRPESYIKQLRYEAQLLLAGTWVPGAKRPQGKADKLAEAIMGAPGISESPTVRREDQRVDALLES